jgi:hypothetical protein
VNTTEPARLTGNLFSQNIGTLGLPIISAALSDFLSTHLYRASFQRYYLPIVITPLLVIHILHILPDIFFPGDFVVDRR